MNPSIEYTSELFESIPEKSGRLAITISENECEIGVASATDFLVFLTKYQREKDQSQLELLRYAFSVHQELFAREFSSVSIGLSNQNFTIIPAVFQGQPSDYLKQVTDISGKTVYRENINADYDFIYGVEQEYHNLFKNTFQHYTVKHLSKLFYTKENNKSADLIGVIAQESFDCLVQKNSKPVSLARHEFSSVEDLTYFVLLSLKDANIGNEKTKVLLAGSIVKTSPIYEALHKYIDSVELLELSMRTRPRHDFQEPFRYHYHLLNLLDENN